MNIQFMLLRTLRVFISVGLTLVALTSVAFAQSRTPEGAPTPLSEAQAALERRDWANAEALLSPLVKTEPKNPYAYFELAQLYENTNRVQAAKNIYQAIAAIPEAEKSNYVVIAVKENKRYMVLLPNLAQEKLDALNHAEIPVSPAPALTTRSSAPAMAPVAARTTSSVENAAPVMSMRQWLAAWQSKQLDAYFASYVPNYKGDVAASTDAWQKARTQRINTKTKIAINAYDVVMIPLDAQQVQLDFTQAYVSNSFVDITHKTLVMTNSNGRWLITKETTK